MIYVPQLNNNNCVVLHNSTTIRVYNVRPNANNTYYYYTDYYINSNYLSNVGSQYFSTNSTPPPCRTDITTDFWYRSDISDIMIVYFVLCIVLFYIPYKLIRKAWFSK